MPFSVDPQPQDHQTECGRCGAHFDFELSRCPACGVNLYDPEDDLDINSASPHQSGELFAKIGSRLRRFLGIPYSANQVFGDTLNHTELYKELLSKVGGDHHVVERLIRFESEDQPHGSRITWLQNAIQRWDRDNRLPRHHQPV